MDTNNESEHTSGQDNIYPKKGSMEASFNLAAFLPPEDRQKLLDSLVTVSLRNTVNDQLEIPSLHPLQQHEPAYTIEHRKQSGPYCALESLARTLQAVGIQIDADTVVLEGSRIGLSDGSPLLMLDKLIEELGLDNQVVMEMLPTKNIEDIEGLMEFYALFVKSYSRQLQEPQTDPKEIDTSIDEKDDEAQKQKVQEWIDILDEENAIILQVEGNDFWLIPDKFKKAKDSTHAIALTGYNVDESGVLSFSVYDPALPEGPISVGPKHLVSTAANNYLKIARVNKDSTPEETIKAA